MAREKSPLLFSGSLEVEMQGPLDARRSVKRLTDLTDANSFPYIYKGLDVFCEETGKWYTFMGEDKTSMSNWREEGSGGGTVDQTYNATSTNAQSGTAVAEAVASMGSDVLVVDLWHPYDEEASAETDYESEIYRSELSITPEEIIAASRSKKLVLLQDHYDGATAESPSPKYYPCLHTLVTAFESWHHNDDKSGNFGYRLIFKEWNHNDYQASIIEANYYDGVSYRELSFVNYGALTINIDTAIAKERESTLRDYFEGAEYAEEGRGKVTFTSPDRKVPWETDPTDSTVFEGTDYGVHMYAWEDLEYENPFTHIDAELTSKTYVAEKIAEAMTDVDNEHFHPVTALPDPADEDPTKRPKVNHEYILIEYEQDGITIKSETHYLFYGGTYHQKPTGGISLEGYATEEFVNTKTAKMGEFDVATIPQGPTGANEINAVLSNKDNEGAIVSYVRQADGTLPNVVRMNVRSGLGEDSFELPTKALVDDEHVELTQAEYDALSESEKKNGKVYFITDASSGAQTEVLYLDNRILFTRCGNVYSIRLSGASAEEIEACADLIKSHVDSMAVIYLPMVVGVAATLNRVYGYLAIHQSTCTVFKIATYGGGASALDATDRAFGTGTWIKG